VALTLTLRHPVDSSRAVFDDSITLAHIALKRGLTVDTRDGNGRTALHIAASQHNVRFARFLLDRGAGVDAADRHGMTPLLFAVQNDDAVMARLLMRHGASLKTMDRDHGWTAMQLARRLHAERFLALVKTGVIVAPIPVCPSPTNRMRLDRRHWLIVHDLRVNLPDSRITLVVRDGRACRVATLPSWTAPELAVFRECGPPAWIYIPTTDVRPRYP
jgi:hypothetical protein